MKFMKIALGVNSKATNFAVRPELGRFPLHIKIYTAMLIFVIRYLVEALLVITVNFSHYWLVNGQLKVKRISNNEIPHIK